MSQHVCHAIFVEEISAVFHFQPYFIPVVGREEKQVEFGRIARRQQRIDRQAVEPDKGQLLIAVAPVEHHLKQWRVTAVSFRTKFPNDMIEGNGAMGIEVQDSFLHAPEQFAKGPVQSFVRNT